MAVTETHSMFTMHNKPTLHCKTNLASKHSRITHSVRERLQRIKSRKKKNLKRGKIWVVWAQTCTAPRRLAISFSHSFLFIFRKEYRWSIKKILKQERLRLGPVQFSCELNQIFGCNSWTILTNFFLCFRSLRATTLIKRLLIPRLPLGSIFSKVSSWVRVIRCPATSFLPMTLMSNSSIKICRDSPFLTRLLFSSCHFHSQ